jgi:hypothetical protein
VERRREQKWNKITRCCLKSDKCLIFLAGFFILFYDINPHIACCCNLIKLKRHNKKTKQEKYQTNKTKKKRDMNVMFKKAPRSTRDFSACMMSEKCHKIV